MVIRVVKFSREGGTKLERFLPKNQHNYPKEIGRCQKLSIILENKVIWKFMLSINVNNKKCAPKFVFFNEKKSERFW